MGIFTPLAVKIGSAPWMPKYLPQIVKCDNAVQAITRQRYGLLDIAGLPNVTLLVAGRRSGVVRRTRLLAAPEANGTWLIAGSYFGGPNMPQWALNVRATDHAEIVHRGTTIPVSVRELEGSERDAGWQRLRAMWPNFDLYVQRTQRQIPVFRLDPAA